MYVKVANFAYSYVEMGSDKKSKDDKEEVKDKSDQSFREADKKVDAGEEYAKQFTQG